MKTTALQTALYVPAPFVTDTKANRRVLCVFYVPLRRLYCPGDGDAGGAVRNLLDPTIRSNICVYVYV